MAMPPVVRLRQSLALPLLLGGVWLGAAASLRAQVTGAGPGGLNTAVNGVVGGSCSTGLCQVTGGTAAGSNLFHRFSNFDTRGAITGVQINNTGLLNVMVGVTAPLGSFIDKPVSLTSPGNLFWLSPGGIAISGSGGFINTTQLTLTTATNQLIGAGRFDVFGTTPEQAALLSGTPGTRARDLVLDPAARALAGMDPDPKIEFNGVQITVDRSLLVDNPSGLVSVAGSSLSASSSTGQGGSLTLTGSQVWVDGTSKLLATGPSGGGLIQVGGSWQNSDIDVRQAYTTWVGKGALLDASATANGNGGTIVVWSDITNPAGATAAYGTLRAMGGPEGGNGGQIETSGKWLGVNGISVSTLAPKGVSGRWLLDPNDLTIVDNSYSYQLTDVDVIKTPPSSPSTFTADPAVSTSQLTSGTINNALNSGNANIEIIADGSITFAPTSSPSGVTNFYISSGPTSSVVLTFRAVNNIVLNSAIALTDYGGLGATLNLISSSGGLTGAVTIKLSNSGGMVNAPPPLSLVVNQGGNTIYSGGFISQPANSSLFSFTKDGGGSLTYAPSIDTTSQPPWGYSVVGGSLISGATNAFGQAGTLSVDNSGVFSIGSFNQNFSSVSISSGLISGGAGVLSASSISADAGTISANLAGSGTLMKSSPGTLILSGNNTYGDVLTGGTTVSAGVIRAQSSTAFGAGTVSIAAGAAVELQGDIKVANNFYIKGTGPSNTGALRNLSGSNTITGLVTWAGQTSNIAADAGSLTFDRQGTGQNALEVYGFSSPDVDLVVGGSGNISFNDPINLLDSSSGIYGNLVKSGSGTLSLGAGNTIGPSVSLIGGTLAVSSPDFWNSSSATGRKLSIDSAVFQSNFSGAIATSGNGSVVIGSGGGTWLVDSGNSISFDGVVSGSGSFTKSGGGILSLSAVNTYTGNTNVNAGTLLVTGGLSENTALTVNSGATYQLGVSDTIGSITGNGSIALGGFTLTTGGAIPTSGTGSLGTFSGSISGTGGLTKVGSGTMTLAGVNTYTGATTVNAGTLLVTGGLSENTTLTVNSGATYELGVSDTIGSITGNGSIALGGFTLTTGGAIPTSGAGSLGTFSGSITGTGGLTKVGSGTMTLAGTNTYTGATTVDAGTLLVSGSLSDSTALTVNSGAIYQLGASETIGSIAGEGSIALGGFTLTTGGAIPTSGNVSLGTFSGSISGTGGLTKVGSGTMTLAGVNTYTGATTVNAGTLLVTGGLSENTALTVNSGATYQLGVSDTIGSIAGNGSIALGSFTLTTGGAIPTSGNVSLGTFSGSISGTGGLTKVGSGTMTLAGTNTYTGPTNVDEGTLLVTGRLSETTALTVDSDATYQLGASATIGSIAGSGDIELGNFTLTTGGAIPASGNVSLGTFSGSISGTGGLTKVGSGTMTLAGSNSYTGATVVNAGTLRVTGNLSELTALTVNSGATYQLGASDTIGSIAGSGTIDLASFTLTAGENDTSTAFDGSLTGSGNLVKSGNGTLTLNGTNSYTGKTTVADGVLTVNRKPPYEATCTGGSSNICASTYTEFASQLAQASLIDSTPGFSVDSSTDVGSPTSAIADSDAAETWNSMGDVDTSDGSTLIANADTSVTSSLDSSFDTSDVDSSVASDGGDGGDRGEGADADADAGARESRSGESDAEGSGKDADGNQALSQGEGSGSETDAAPASPPTTEVAPQQAAESSQQADQRQSMEAVNALVPELSGRASTSLSVPQMQRSLEAAASQVRRGGGGDLGPQSWLPPADQDWLMAGGLQQVSSDVGRAAMLPPKFNRAAYTPAVMHVRFSDASGGTVQAKTDAFLDITLIPMKGEVEGRRVEVSKKEFAALLKQLYVQLSRQESLKTANPASPSRRLYELLIAPMAPELAKQGITTLLISADRGLQAVPFAALHSGERYFGDAYAFALTPSLALTNLTPPQLSGGRLLAAGSAVFDGLAPLPLVPTELQKVGRSDSKDIELNKAFTPATLLDQAGDQRYSRVHVATHAEFLPGGPAASKLYSGTVPIPLREFVKLRRARAEAPLDLISFSACRTALGDADSELGFAGLALQAGARSAVGTLWYVDDVATSAYFVQMYRYLDAGVPKAEALQLTRQAFSRGLVRLDGDRVLGPDEAVLINGLTDAQQRRVAEGLANPYFWAGIELLGSPW